MDQLTWWQELLFQSLISLIGGLLGGGAISAYLDWKRFRREQAEIAREEQRFAIEPISALIQVDRWEPTKRMNDGLKLYMYENGLMDSVREYRIVAEFVVRNLTDQELIITRVEVVEFNVPPLNDAWGGIGEDDEQYAACSTSQGTIFVNLKSAQHVVYDTCSYYDWKTKEEQSMGFRNVALAPKGTIQVAYVAARRFFALRRLDTPPKTISVVVDSAGGHRVVEILNLTNGPVLRTPLRVGGYEVPSDSFERWRSEQAIEKRAKEALDEHEEEIPF
jgi:hypothetical protein